jgi:LysR family nitrogen assimilation transcriptional regulator
MLIPDRKGLQIEDLRHFVQAAEHGSLTAAATAAGVAQSAFSRQLSRLEATLGGRLLHRTGRGVVLTELGRHVLPRAHALLADASALVEEAGGNWQRPTGVVNVGLLPSMSRPMTGRLYARVSEAFPDIQLRVVEAYSGQIEVMLAEGHIDVGTFNRYRPLQRENQDAVLSSPLCLIAAPGGPHSGKASVRFSALAGLPLVMPMRPNSLRALFEEVAGRRRLSMHVALEVSSATAMKDAVMSCGLHATLPAHAVQDELARGLLECMPITHPAIRQTTFIDVTRRRPASSAVREVARLLSGLVRQLGSPA